MRARSRDGVEIAVHDLGGAGDPLVLVHATGFHARAYAPLAALLGSRFHVWGVDVRAHGASDRSDEVRWADLAGDVLAAVESLGLEGPVGFGHSMGGTALVLAEREHPGTFRALYLYEPILFDAPEGVVVDDNPLAKGARSRRARFGSREQALDNYRGKLPLSEPSLRAYVEHGFVDEPGGGVHLACRPEDEARTYATAPGAGAFAALPSVRCPTVVARGSDEDDLPVRFAAPAAAALPNGRLVVLPGLDHFGPLAQEAAVAESVISELG